MRLMPLTKNAARQLTYRYLNVLFADAKFAKNGVEQIVGGDLTG